MNKIFCVNIFFFFLLNGYAQDDPIFLDNLNSMYKKDIVLEHIFKRFDKVNYHYPPLRKCFCKISEIPFFIFDLTDTLNGIDTLNIRFLNKHIYHIGAFNTYCKVSIIMIPFDGKLFFFEGLNCAKKIHKIEDVLYWIENNYKEQLGEIDIKRIMNYQKYHKSFAIDPQGSKPVCELSKYKKRKTQDKVKPPVEIDLQISPKNQKKRVEYLDKG